MICWDTHIIRYNLILFKDTYGWMGGLMGGLMSNNWNQINLDPIKIIQLWTFLTFFWTFYLNHLSPLWGYFPSCHWLYLLEELPFYPWLLLPSFFVASWTSFVAVLIIALWFDLYSHNITAQNIVWCSTVSLVSTNSLMNKFRISYLPWW